MIYRQTCNLEISGKLKVYDDLVDIFSKCFTHRFISKFIVHEIFIFKETFDLKISRF